tara:strand:+ start:24 stop:284 length:261 start_codon:yes stop_codon:yes gene_type:complete
MGGGPVGRKNLMLAYGLSTAKNAISTIWGAINGDHADVQNVHDATQRCELSDIFAVKFKPAGGAALTTHEQFECDTMFKLREILHD